MVFGGKKFESWKQENPVRLANIYVQSDGDANVMENLLNQETLGECRKQIREFISKAYDLGYFNKGTSEIEEKEEKRKKEKKQRDLQRQWSDQNYRETQKRMSDNAYNAYRQRQRMGFR